MDDVQKLVAEDRGYDALATLIPMAQGGNPAAQYELAGFYHYGYVGSNDYAKALKWYRASARQGYADSMVGLSVLYLGGQGVAKDPREAFVWLNLAAQYMTDKHALAKVTQVRDEIGRRLTKDDIAFAKAETILLQPESTSVQPNEAESIDHLPDTLPPEPAPVVSEPLQNVPPDTAPLTAPLAAPLTAMPSVPEIQLQNAPPEAPATAKPAGTLPVSTSPASTAPASTSPTAPSARSLPATTPPATPPVTPPLTPWAVPSPPAPEPTAAPAGSQSGGVTMPVEPVPQF
jgi:hypothetical protein